MPHALRAMATPLFTILACVLIAAACGSDDGSQGDNATQSDDGSEGDPSATATAETSAEAETPEPSASPTESEDDGDEPIELTASFQGVTEDSIKVGVLYPDLEAVAELGVNIDHGPYDGAYAAVIDAVNADGGVLGRRIDPIFRAVNPVLLTDLEAACVSLTQDEEVFAVIGDVLDDQPLCFTELNDTAMVGSTQTDERLARSTAPWYSPNRNSDELNEAIVSGFIDRGLLTGGTIAVVATTADESLVNEVVLPLLDEADVESATTTILSADPNDTRASEAEMDVVVERHRSEGVTHVLTIATTSASYPGGLERSSFRPQVLATSLSNMRAYIRDESGRDLSVLEGSVAGNAAEQLIWWEDPEVQACVDLVEAAGGDTILDPNTRGEDEPENLVSVATACRNVYLFLALAEAAGPDLTNESFAGAGATLGAFHVPGQGDANYDTGGADGDVPLYFYEWSDEAQDLLPDGSTL